MEAKQLKTKGLNGFFLILIMMLGGVTLKAHVNADNYSSIVIIKVNGLNGNTYNKIAKGINKEAGLSLEYSCLESNIIVIKYKHTFTEKGDVQHFINNKMKKWIGKTKIEFIHIDLVLGGSSKC